MSGSSIVSKRWRQEWREAVQEAHSAAEEVASLWVAEGQLQVCTGDASTLRGMLHDLLLGYWKCVCNLPGRLRLQQHQQYAATVVAEHRNCS
jgi:hypothetical protein